MGSRSPRHSGFTLTIDLARVYRTVYVLLKRMIIQMRSTTSFLRLLPTPLERAVVGGVDSTTVDAGQAQSEAGVASPFLAPFVLYYMFSLHNKQGTFLSSREAASRTAWSRSPGLQVWRATHHGVCGASFTEDFGWLLRSVLVPGKSPPLVDNLTMYVDARSRCCDKRHDKQQKQLRLNRRANL